MAESTNSNINVRNVYIELLNKMKAIEGVDIEYIDKLVQLLYDDINLIDIDVKNIKDLIPEDATTTNQLATMSDLPAAQVNADWNASSGVSEILNKPTIPAAQSEFITNAVTLTTTWYGPDLNDRYWCYFDFTGRLDTTKAWFINLIPWDSTEETPTAQASAHYNTIIKYVLEQESTNNIRLSIYAPAAPSASYKIQFSFWKLP